MRTRFLCLILLLIFLLAGAIAKADAGDKAQIRKIVLSRVSLRADWIEIKIVKEWSFVDVAQKAADGTWESSTSALLRKSAGQWKFLAKGDPLDESWQKYIKQMPKDVKKAFEEWKNSHL